MQTKVGILTFHKTQNYGALLQAYALQKKLNELGFKTEIIDYYYPGWENGYYANKHRKDINPLKTMYRTLQNLFLRKSLNSRHEKSRFFIENILPTSRGIYKSYDALNSITEKEYSHIICGSDQIWNPFFRAADNAYYLRFASEGIKRIAYAASFGVNELPLEYVRKRVTDFKKFNHISLREKRGLELIKEILPEKNDIKHTLDPTFLLDKEEWQQLVNGVQNVNSIQSDYILCYFLGDYRTISSRLYSISKKYKQPIYFIGNDFRIRLFSKYKLIADAGPINFLSLIKNATLVITDSFHGSVFSIIFEKEFYSVVNNSTDRKKMASRLYSLLSMFGLEYRILSEQDENQINYEIVRKVIRVKQAESIDYLLTSLK